MYNQGKEPLRRCMVRGPPPSLIHSVFPPSVSSLPSKVQVLYGGTDLFDYEVRRTFNNDMLLAFISSSCIAALVYILTSCSGMVSPAAPHGASPFVPPSVLLSGQSLPAWECHKWAWIHCIRAGGGTAAQTSPSNPGQGDWGVEADWAMPQGLLPKDLLQFNLLFFDGLFLVDKFCRVWSIGHFMDYSLACLLL